MGIGLGIGSGLGSGSRPDLKQLGAEHRPAPAAVERAIGRAALRAALRVAQEEPVGQLQLLEVAALTALVGMRLVGVGLRLRLG